MEKTNEAVVEEAGLCPSMYSYHSSPEEKNKLLHSLTQYGLETTVDRLAKKDRIREWIENSTIIEEEDGGDEAMMENSSAETRTQTIRNIGNSRSRRHHQTRKSTDKEYKPPIDPRIPLENQKPQFNSRSIKKSKNDDAASLNSNTTDNDHKKPPVSILSALPFKNVRINNPYSATTSSDSAISSDSSTMKYKPNKFLLQDSKIAEVSEHIQNKLKFM